MMHNSPHKITGNMKKQNNRSLSKKSLWQTNSSFCLHSPRYMPPASTCWPTWPPISTPAKRQSTYSGLPCFPFPSSGHPAPPSPHSFIDLSQPPTAAGSPWKPTNQSCQGSRWAICRDASLPFLPSSLSPSFTPGL